MGQNKIIAIAGLKNSGKDTSSDMLCYLLNAPKCFRTYWWYKKLKKWPFRKKWEITAFAKPLKQTLSIIINEPLEWFNNRDIKENWYIDLNTFNKYHKSKLLHSSLILSENRFQKLIKSGEPILKEPLISVRQLLQYYGTNVIRKYLGDNTWINATLAKVKNKNIIISDLRFKIELKAIKEKKGICIYIHRDSAKPGTHASEREVIELYDNNKFDYIVKNNGTLEDLFNALKNIVWKEIKL